MERELVEEKDERKDSESEDEGEPASDAFLSMSTSLPLIDLPISLDELTADDIILPTRDQIIDDQCNDDKLKQIRKWVNAQTRPSADKIAPYSAA